MSKCLITGKDTNGKVKGKPLDSSARGLLQTITDRYNEKLFESFKEGAIEGSEKTGKPLYDDKILKQMAPSVSKNDILKALEKGGNKELNEIIVEEVERVEGP